MKRKELQKCCACGLGLMAHGFITFWRLNLERMVVDVDAVRRRAGMEEAMGGGVGGAVLAQALGPDDDLAKVVTEPVVLFFCEACASKARTLTELEAFNPIPT